MNARNGLADRPEMPSSPPSMARAGRTIWTIGLLVAAVITALAFGAYRQPELLLNIMALRYCG